MIITNIEQLKQPCVLALDSEVPSIIEELDKELLQANKFGVSGIGLAAPQIGIQKKIAIIRIGEIKINLVNCSIAECFDMNLSQEGCLSFPCQTFLVERYNEVIIKDNTLGNINNFVGYGLLAVAIQHEVDHYNSVLAIDKVLPERYNMSDNMPCYCGSKIKFKKCCKRKQ